MQTPSPYYKIFHISGNMIPEKGIKNLLWVMWDAFTDLILMVLTIAAILSLGLSYHLPKNA